MMTTGRPGGRDLVVHSRSTRSLYRDATTATKQLILVSGQTHGFFDLNPSAKQVDMAVLAFNAKHT